MSGGKSIPILLLFLVMTLYAVTKDPLTNKRPYLPVQSNLTVDEGSGTITNNNRGFSELIRSTLKQTDFQGNRSNRIFIYHEPIYIDGNKNFITTAMEEGWEGDGSNSNPYIIENYLINQSDNLSDSLIEIRNTNLTFVISSNYLNGSSKNREGIAFYNVSNGKVQNNSIYENNLGIQIYLSEKEIIISGNTICGSLVNAFSIHSSNNIIITNNSLYNNFGGFKAYLSSEMKITNNNIFQNRIDGISLIRSTNNQIYDNSIHSNRNAGINLYQSYNNVISENDIFLNAGDGMKFRMSSNNNTVTNNLISNNYDYGIDIRSSKNNTLKNNLISNNVEYGLKIQSSNTITLLNNEICSNFRDGIIYEFSDNNSICNNSICNNIGRGIAFVNSCNNSICKNIIYRNFQNSISLNAFSFSNFVMRNDFAFSERIQVIDNGGMNIYLYNHWSEWISPDMNNDGIVDVSYRIFGTSSGDQSPAVTPYHLSKPEIQSIYTEPPLNNIVTIHWTEGLDIKHLVTYELYYSINGQRDWKLGDFTPNSPHLFGEAAFKWNILNLELASKKCFIKISAKCSAGFVAESKVKVFLLKEVICLTSIGIEISLGIVCIAIFSLFYRKRR